MSHIFAGRRVWEAATGRAADRVRIHPDNVIQLKRQIATIYAPEEGRVLREFAAVRGLVLTEDESVPFGTMQFD